MQVNILEVKTELSKLIKLIETGKEDQIIIARYGKPVAKMTIYNDAPVSKRIGAAKGTLKSPDDLDRYNGEIVQMFEGRTYESTAGHAYPDLGAEWGPEAAS